MLRAGVTVGCAAAMIAAAVLAVRLRHTRWTPTPLDGSEPFGERLAVTLGRSGGMLVGAYVAGVLTVGAGGRLLMRLLAATSPTSAQGRLTEAEEVVGTVTVGGSAFLILGLGIGMALVGLAFFSALRRWLPDRSIAAGLVGVAIGAGVLARPTGLLSSTNPDFTILSPVALAVAFILAMLVLFGASFGVLVDHLAARWPRPGWSPAGVASVLPFGVLLPVPSAFAIAVAAVGGATLASGLRSPSRRAADAASDADRSSVRFGPILLFALGAVGAVSVVVAAAQVLTV